MVVKTIRVEERNYQRLLAIKGFLEQKFKQPFSINDTIETLLDLYDERGFEYFATTPEDLGYRIIKKKR